MNVPVTNLNSLSVLTANNTFLIKKYISIFLANAPDAITQITKCISTSDRQSVRALAHSIVPQVTYMGMEEEAGKLRLIETLCMANEPMDTIENIHRALVPRFEQAFDELKDALNSLS